MKVTVEKIFGYAWILVGFYAFSNSLIFIGVLSILLGSWLLRLKEKKV